MKAEKLFILVGLTLAACGEFEESAVTEPQAQQNTIIGGTPTQGDPAVVAIYGRKPGAEQGMLCTATVITPTVLLAAAHCFDPQVTGYGLEYIAFFGHDLTDPDAKGPILEIAETHHHPNFSRWNLPNGFDIGVAILAEPTDVTPIPINRATLTPGMKGKPARIVGYGLNNGFKQTGAGIKREASLVLNNYDDKLVKTGMWGKNICQGDSGGPVLMNINGKETVVGVNSFGFIFCLFGGNSTRVDTYIDWIDQYLE